MLSYMGSWKLEPRGVELGCKTAHILSASWMGIFLLVKLYEKTAQ